MNEDFVPFELAKKLKEKGFKQGYNIFGYKLIYSNNTTIKYISDIGAYDKEYFGENVSCPTISQVLEWLRNDKKIFIVVCIDDDSDYPVTYNIFSETDCVHHHHGKYFSLSEWSKCEMAGIEYVIDNLI